ncbi:MAG: hypothetical protein ACQEWM_05100 [Actinomycetota bacterium]
MSDRSTIRLEGDGVRAADRLPRAAMLTITPLLIYVIVGHGMATGTGWHLTSAVRDVETWSSGLVEMRLVPSLWVFLIAVAVALVAHGLARNLWATDPVRAVDTKIAGVIVVWVLVGLAVFGAWAWIAAVASGGVEAFVPFPLMGSIAPVL